MTHLPPEISPLQFPCALPVKAFGRADCDLAALVCALAQQHVGSESVLSWQVRPSRGGNWQAVTAVVQADNRAQMDALYQALTAHEWIAYAL